MPVCRWTRCCPCFWVSQLTPHATFGQQADKIIDLVVSRCLSVSPPPAAATGGKKKTSTTWRSVQKAGVSFLASIVIGTQSIDTPDSDDEELGDDDTFAKRQERCASVLASLTTVAQEVANTVTSQHTDRCTDGREYLLIAACRFVFIFQMLNNQ